MRTLWINNLDINGKATALLIIYMLAVALLFQADRIPARPVVLEAKVVNMAEPEGGRLYSLVPPGDSRVDVRGLTYQVPRRRQRAQRLFTGISIETVRDEGLLKGYSLPPERVTFTPEGLAVVLPASPVLDGPRAPDVVFNGNRRRPRVALTFDTSDVREPQARTIIDILTDLRVPATLFVTGQWCYANQHLLREAVDRGFEIANHSYGHPEFTGLSDGRVLRELSLTEKAMGEMSGGRMAAYFRPPYGDIDDRVAALVGRAGYVTIMWVQDTLDWHSSTGPGQVRDRALEGVRNGDIVLMHMNGRHTPRDLPEIVSNLRAMGFELTTVSGVLEP